MSHLAESTLLLCSGYTHKDMLELTHGNVKSGRISSTLKFVQHYESKTLLSRVSLDSGYCQDFHFTDRKLRPWNEIEPVYLDRHCIVLGNTLYQQYDYRVKTNRNSHLFFGAHVSQRRIFVNSTTIWNYKFCRLLFALFFVLLQSVGCLNIRGSHVNSAIKSFGACVHTVHSRVIGNQLYMGFTKQVWIDQRVDCLSVLPFLQAKGRPHASV